MASPTIEAIVNPSNLGDAETDLANSDFGENPNPLDETRAVRSADWIYALKQIREEKDNALKQRVKDVYPLTFAGGREGPDYEGFLRNYGSLVGTKNYARMAEGLRQYFGRFKPGGSHDLIRYEGDSEGIGKVFFHVVNSAVKLVAKKNRALTA